MKNKIVKAVLLILAISIFIAMAVGSDTDDISTIDDVFATENRDATEDSDVTEKAYDVDADLVVVQCEKETSKTNMYHITFAEVDSDKNPIKFYTFGSVINPRTMGTEFHVIGDLPSWFYVGATVHVKAKLYADGELSQSDCIVTEAAGSSDLPLNSTPKQESKPMPVMNGTNLDSILEVAKTYGMSRAWSDESFGSGTKMCALKNSNGGLTLDIIYSTSTKEILCGTIVTFNGYSSSEDQKAFIKAMAGALCPKSDQSEVATWVNSNIGGVAETTINGFVYEVAIGPAGNYNYNAGDRNYTEWLISLG